MPRKKRIYKTKKYKKSDPIYESLLVSHFINKILKKGKKTLAESIVYNAFKIVKEKTGKLELEAFEQAIEKCKPLVEVKPRRVGGATYQVPVEVVPERGINLSMKWILESAKKRSGKSFSEKLASEIIDALSETGGAIKKKTDVHKMAEANRSYSHYRW